MHLAFDLRQFVHARPTFDLFAATDDPISGAFSDRGSLGMATFGTLPDEDMARVSRLR